MPPNAYILNTEAKYRAAEDYRRVLFFKPSAVDNNPQWLTNEGERFEHPNYDPEKYPAVTLHSLQSKRFKKGQVIDLTACVRQRMQERRSNKFDYEELLTLSRRPIIDLEGKSLEKPTYTKLSLTKMLHLGK